jgi:hypothetical protein
MRLNVLLAAADAISRENKATGILINSHIPLPLIVQNAVFPSQVRCNDN